MRRADAGGPLGPLGEAFMAAAGASEGGELTGRLHRLREPRRWAGLAHVVFETAAGDAGSDALIARAADGLAGLVDRVRKALSFKGPVVLAGGLILNHPDLEAAVRRRLGRGTIRLEEPPVAGAVRLAESALPSR
jgi:glucosamine kinase